MARFAHRYVTGAELARGQRVLEVACGSGAGLGCLAPEARELVGLDATESLLHAARAQAGTQLALACGDAQHLPVADAAFDRVLCFESIYYLADYRVFLRESRRVLAAHGLLLIVYANPEWPQFVPGPLTTHYPTVPELADAMERAGFRTVHFAGILPATRDTAKQKVINRLRRVATRTKLLPRTGPLADALKQLSYGALVTLPGHVTLPLLAPYAAEVTPTALPSHMSDHTHRVIYAYGET